MKIPSIEIGSFQRRDYVKMKFFIGLSAVMVAVSAMPTEIDQESTVLNGTRILNRQAGFASFGGGTHGGNGGAVWTVWDPWALRDAIKGNERRIIYVRGRLDLTQLFTGSPGVFLEVGSFKTIMGGDSNAEIFGGGLRVRHSEQVIIQNLKITNVLSYAPGEQPNGNGGIISMVPGAYSFVDGVGVQTSEHVWVDHCEFSDDPFIAASIPENMRRHDGLIDITSGANWISVSNSIFRNHNMVMLVGNDDNNAAQDRGRLKVTYYGNWFMGTVQRNPRVRHGEVHVLNNLYTDIRSYGVGVGAGALIYLEKNVFINTSRAWGFASGVPNPAGFLLNVDNRLINSRHDARIPSDGVRWNPSQYYWYSPLSTDYVESSVRRNAGVW